MKKINITINYTTVTCGQHSNLRVLNQSIAKVKTNHKISFKEYLKRLQSSTQLANVILKHKIKRVGQASVEPLLTTKEVCSKYGISERTVRRWRKSGRLSFVQNGHNIFFKPSSVKHALNHKK